MFSYLLNLFERIEQSGIRLTIDEKIDTLKAVTLIDLSNKDRFFDTIVANTAHNLVEREKIRKILTSSDEPSSKVNIDINELASRISSDLYARTQFIKSLLTDRQFQSILNLTQDRKEILSSPEIYRRLYDALVWEEREDEFFEILIRDSRSDTTIRQRLNKILDEMRSRSLNTIKNEEREGIKTTDISYIKFSEITDKELNRLQTAIRLAARRLLKKAYDYQCVNRSANLNIHRTLRKNAALDNIPFELIFKRRRKKKRDIIVLCDMSESVRSTAFVMIAFINELTQLFNRVRSFAFVSDVTEITSIVSRKNLESVIHSLISGSVSNMFGNSNYSLFFYRFFQRYRAILNRNTIVIIIGDGRNNYNEPNLVDLRNIRRNVHRLYWFVPESKELWGKGDSQLPLYLTYSDRAFTTLNLNQLSTAILKIAQ
jgi:uncharacterized protein with von Willebrand factor type A (vWA) domain